MYRRAQHAYYDVNKFNEEQWSQSVTNGEWVELIRCIYQSVVCTELVTFIGYFSMFVGSVKELSGGCIVLNDKVQCKR